MTHYIRGPQDTPSEQEIQAFEEQYEAGGYMFGRDDLSKAYILRYLYEEKDLDNTEIADLIPGANYATVRLCLIWHGIIQDNSTVPIHVRLKRPPWSVQQ